MHEQHLHKNHSEMLGEEEQKSSKVQEEFIFSESKLFQAYYAVCKTDTDVGC
jgi:hypothetical protein